MHCIAPIAWMLALMCVRLVWFLAYHGIEWISYCMAAYILHLEAVLSFATILFQYALHCNLVISSF